MGQIISNFKLSQEIMFVTVCLQSNFLQFDDFFLSWKNSKNSIFLQNFCYCLKNVIVIRLNTWSWTVQLNWPRTSLSNMSGAFIWAVEIITTWCPDWFWTIIGTKMWLNMEPLTWRDWDWSTRILITPGIFWSDGELWTGLSIKLLVIK